MKNLIKMLALCNLVFIVSCTKDNPVFVDGGVTDENDHPTAEYQVPQVKTPLWADVFDEMEKVKSNPPTSNSFVEDEGELVFVYLIGSGYVAHGGGSGPNSALYTYGEFNINGNLGEGRVIIEHEQRIRRGFKGQTSIELDVGTIILRDNIGEFYIGQSSIVKGDGVLKTAHGTLQKYIFDEGLSNDKSGTKKGIALFGWLVIDADKRPDLS